ncbi:hypothetical protein CAEBREN_03325 [Caenorhabditis brenneri]|uniref:Uncharacterized protein n=1 Tax=Caenorhabditis brenneri TaxID=135651 RepID=G0P2A1_CAEBE|nr:hypothetical protein CAEBREN_03325 [Caenorhabditis brenneri]
MQHQYGIPTPKSEYIRIRITDENYYCNEENCDEFFILGEKGEIQDHYELVHGWKNIQLSDFTFFVRNGKQETGITQTELLEWVKDKDRGGIFESIQKQRQNRKPTKDDIQEMKKLSKEMRKNPCTYPMTKAAYQLERFTGCINPEFESAILNVIHQMGKQGTTIPQFNHDDPTPHLCFGRWLIKLFMDQKDLGTKHSIIFGLRLLKRGIQLRYMKKRIFDHFLYKTLKEMWQEEATSKEHHIRLREIRLEILQVVNAYDDLFEDSRWVIEARKEIYFSNIFGLDQLIIQQRRDLKVAAEN